MIGSIFALIFLTAACLFLYVLYNVVKRCILRWRYCNKLKRKLKQEALDDSE